MANSATKSSLCCLYHPSGFQECWLPGHEAVCAWRSSSWGRVWQSIHSLFCVCGALSSVPCSGLPQIARLNLDPRPLQEHVGLSKQREENLNPPNSRTETCAEQNCCSSTGAPEPNFAAHPRLWQLGKGEGCGRALPREHPAPSRILNQNR